MTEMTVDGLKQVLPKHLHCAANQELADKINSIAGDEEVARYVRDNFVSYTKVLSEGRFKTEDYLNAVTYVTFKLMGYSNKDAYAKTFPDRYTKLIADGRSDKEISAYVAGYHKNKLVNQILEQAVIPSWLVNQDVFQRAINTQFELMTDTDVSPKVRSDAANSLLTHLKPPETKKFEMDVTVKPQGGIAELTDTLARLAAEQLKQIQAGTGAQQVARVAVQTDEQIVDAEFTQAQLPPPEPSPLLQQQPLHKMHPEQAMAELMKDAGPGRLSLFGDAPKAAAAPAETTTAWATTSIQTQVPEEQTHINTGAVFELRSPGVNYARCCEGGLEDCSCEIIDHIYLPVKTDSVPAALRGRGRSLFDQPFGGDE